MCVIEVQSAQNSLQFVSHLGLGEHTEKLALQFGAH